MKKRDTHIGIIGDHRDPSLERLGRALAEEDVKVFCSAADTGVISQNVYLYCASEGLATVVRGLIDRPVLEQAMKLRPDQKVTLSQSVGYPKK